MPKQSLEKPKRKPEPYTSILVVNWVKPEDDPIRHADYCRNITELLNYCMAQMEQKKNAVEKTDS